MGDTNIKYQKAVHRVRFDGAYVPNSGTHVRAHGEVRGALDELYGGSTIKHFTREVFLTLQSLPVPPLAEQYRIVGEIDRRLSLAREVEAEVDTNLKRAERLRQATLHEAFAGASFAR